MSTEPTFNGRVISDEEFEAMADDVVANPPTFTGEPRRRGERPSLGDGPSRSVQARRSTEPTFDGRVISDEEFEAMADDVVANPPAFTGEPRRRGGRPSLGDGPSRVAQVRLSPADYDAVLSAARSRTKTLSEFVRQAAIEATRSS